MAGPRLYWADWSPTRSGGTYVRTVINVCMDFFGKSKLLGIVRSVVHKLMHASILAQLLIVFFYIMSSTYVLSSDARQLQY